MTQNANFDKFRDMIGFWKKNSIKNTFHVGHLILVTLTPKSNSKNNLLHTGPKCATCEKTFQTKELFSSNLSVLKKKSDMDWHA